MNRRELIALLGSAAAVAWPKAMWAEQPQRPPTIGFLGLQPASAFASRSEIKVRADKPGGPGSAVGSTWPLRNAWNRASENLFSAWIEKQLAIRGIRTLMHSTSIEQVGPNERKALSAFSFGSARFILAPEMSNQILSCLTDITDITGLVNNISISGPGIKFMVDNEVWDVAAWACESTCFANNPTQQLGSGLGELEIKPESLRYIVCATRELLEDSSVNLEQWMLQKAGTAFRYQISNAILTGDGFGKPLGMMNPQAGVPIMETSDATAPSQFSWQDLLQLGANRGRSGLSGCRAAITHSLNSWPRARADAPARTVREASAPRSAWAGAFFLPCGFLLAARATVGAVLWPHPGPPPPPFATADGGTDPAIFARSVFVVRRLTPSSWRDRSQD